MSTSIGEDGIPIHTVVFNQIDMLNVLGAAQEAGIDTYTVGIDDKRYESTIRMPATDEQLVAFRGVMGRYQKLDREHDKRMEEERSKIWQ
jgi:hypothetical protein